MRIVLCLLLLLGFALGPRLSPALRVRWRAWPGGLRELVTVAALLAATVAVYGGLLVGHLPLVRDHNVHLFKIIELEDMLRTGRVFGWSDAEFAGYPHNVMYPFLGYFIVVALDAIPGVTLTLAYSWTLFAVLWGGVLAVYLAGRLHLSPAAGILAGLFTLVDPGGWLIGGHAWTVGTGVWPASMSLDLVILFLALLPGVLRAGSARRTLVVGALAGLAVLFHPIALLLILLAAPFFLLALVTGDDTPAPRRILVVSATLAVGMLVTSAFWLVPFFRASRFDIEERQFSAFGSADMWRQFTGGQLFGQPALWLGVTICGLLMLAKRRDLFSRFVVTAVVGAVILSTSEALEILGLWKSDGSTVIGILQFRRVYCLIRPLSFLAAAHALVVLVPPALASLGAPRERWKAMVSRAVVAGLGALVVVLPGVRLPGLPDVALPTDLTSSDRADLDHALERSRSLLGPDGRLVLVSAEDDHSMVGPAGLAGIKKIAKIGYTPATRFKHQLAPDPYTAARAGGRAIITRSPPPAGWRKGRVVRSFGRYEVRAMEPAPRAWMEGDGTVRVVSWQDEEIRLAVDGAPDGSEIRLLLGQYDQWRDDRGRKLDPFPYFGMTASSLPARSGEIVLRYHRPAAQWIGLGITVGGLLVAAAWALRQRWRRRRPAAAGEPARPAQSS